MAFLDIQLVKVVFGLLHLGPVDDLKAHAHEDVLDLVENVVHRVLVSDAHILGGQGHVDGLQLQLLLHHRALQLTAARVDGAFNVGAQLVCKLPHGGALLGGELAHLAENAGELALLAEILDAQRLQALCVLTLQDGLDRGVPKLLHHFSHMNLLTIKKLPPHTGTKAKLPRYHPRSAYAAS